MRTRSQLGWYGKLPSLGDFASRRLPPEFIETWDSWLCAGLLDWRQRQPDVWLDAYLTGPSWCFLLMPGVLDARAPIWIGVLMPSVDRVGRYFPLTIAQPLAQLPCDAASIEDLLGWLKDLDDLALDSLREDWTADHLDTELLRLGEWSRSESALPPFSQPTLLQSNARLTPPIELDSNAAIARKLVLMADAGELQRKAIWLCAGPPGKAMLQFSPGLPQGQRFSALLTGRAG